MDLVSLAPFPATTFQWTLDGGARATTVVCKLTFPLAAGTEGALSPVQEPIVDAEDYVPFKAATDIVVTGFAHAPPGTRVRTIQARLVVGDAVNKTLELTGPRSWLPDGQASEPEPVDRVPLRWELAQGGAGTGNPVGMAPDADRAPQIVSAGTRLARGVTAEPAGFGPLDPEWPARVEKLSGAAPLGPAWRDHPLPWNIDPAYFNSAPLDQRTRSLQANESILLFGLLADRERFGMRLPGMQPRAFVQAGAEGKVVPLVADTVRIDTERVIISVTWRGQIPAGVVGERVVVGLHERAGRGVWATFARRLPRVLGAGAEVAAVPLRDAPSEPPRAVTPPPPAHVVVPSYAAAPAPAPAPLPAPVLVVAPMPAFIGKRADAPGAVEPRRPDPEAAAPAPAEPHGPREILDLLWFDKGLVPKLRANRSWRAVIDQLALVPAKPRPGARDTTDADDREEIFQLLANARADEVSAMAKALDSAISPDGKLVPPLAIVAGEVSLPFDPRELLTVTLSAAKPFTATDKAFHEVYAAASAMNEASALGDPVAHGMTFRLREAFQQVKHTLGPRYLEATAERALLDTRRYQRRDVFGASHLRALVTGPSGEPVPAYLPDATTARLPLFSRFRVRLVVEVNAQVDQEEQHPCALRVLAVARAVTRPSAASAAAEPRR